MTVENLPRRQFLRGKFLASLHTKNEQIQGFEGIRPPWSVAENEFVEQCTRCRDCIDICETQILIGGDGGFPEIRFDKGECTFCRKCVEVCRQPIFRPLEEQPWTHKINIGANCLAQQHIECRSCQDNCSMNAIRFRLQIGGVAQPTVNPESCNGCGACIQSCPVNAIEISTLK
ncbi:ferredoxin-type protein NapF [Rodentibacter haemolyticus]|uniref:Ferredoxin-type protein NapF n=1 Tax=Rodentibacter haemolyticus TaxID=2778911 RepID=A0ABX6V1T4_9PAST|nr:ferredoxin-type protein NapF [Rodentibacter haemolyticus]QPB43481.1 ferredoxin-type protein NapF [Rodentibacter haemolyticus]